METISQCLRCSCKVRTDSVLTSCGRIPALASSCAVISDIHDATAAASISDGLVQGSLPVLEPKEYRAFDITPLDVVTRPSPMAGLPFHTAVALRIMIASQT